jgi:hypothetical protein
VTPMYSLNLYIYTRGAVNVHMHGDGDACVPVNSLFPDQSLHGELATAFHDGTFILQEASKRR